MPGERGSPATDGVLGHYGIGVLSDTHGRVARVHAAADLLARRGVSTVVHCGDITGPDVVEALAGLEVHWVLGNCDLDESTLRAAMARLGHTCHGVRGEITVDGCTIAFTHGHRVGVLDALVVARQHDVVLHGHTHERRDVVVNGTRVLCPGALHAAAPPTFAILQPPDLTVEWVELV